MLGFYFLDYNKYTWTVSANSITLSVVGLLLLLALLYVSHLYLVFLHCFLKIIFENLYVEIT